MFRTYYNQDWNSDTFGEIVNGVSMTEPDQSLSVKDIIRRFSAGTLTESEISRPGSYISSDIDNPIPVPKDLTDVTEIANTATSIIEKAQRESNANVKIDKTVSSADTADTDSPECSLRNEG